MAQLRFPIAAACLSMLTLVSAPAHAHFELVAPGNWAAQDAFGSPQKSPPCGQADPDIAAMPNGRVTTVDEGSLFTITIDEKIFHPGHYRVSLAADPASLPADPPVTPGATPCGSTVISASPTLPLLADGLLIHANPFTGPKSFQVALPAGVTCTTCVLQVTEFMSDHPLNNPGGCFYHHCATLSIVGPPDAGPPDSDAGEIAAPDSGLPGADDAGVAAAAGCGCTTGPGFLPIAVIGVIATAMLRLLRRRAV